MFYSHVDFKGSHSQSYSLWISFTNSILASETMTSQYYRLSIFVVASSSRPKVIGEFKDKFKAKSTCNYADNCQIASFVFHFILLRSLPSLIITLSAWKTNKYLGSHWYWRDVNTLCRNILWEPFSPRHFYILFDQYYLYVTFSFGTRLVYTIWEVLARSVNSIELQERTIVILCSFMFNKALLMVP